MSKKILKISTLKFNILFRKRKIEEMFYVITIRNINKRNKKKPLKLFFYILNK